MLTELEVRLLLEAIFDRYHYDFRSYAHGVAEAPPGAGLRPRWAWPRSRGCRSACCTSRSPSPRCCNTSPCRSATCSATRNFFWRLRTQVLPVLATYPSIKVWCAGCSTGEEAYSLAILLHEEGLLDRVDHLRHRHQRAGAARGGAAGVYSSRGCAASPRTIAARARPARCPTTIIQRTGDSAIMDSALRRKITFSDHSLATDNVFSEVHLVTCRNVLIYFDQALQTARCACSRSADRPRLPRPRSQGKPALQRSRRPFDRIRAARAHLPPEGPA